MSQKVEDVPQVRRIAEQAMERGGENFTDLSFLNYIERLVARILTENECDAALAIKHKSKA
jgi:hypothetical protein